MTTVGQTDHRLSTVFSTGYPQAAGMSCWPILFQVRGPSQDICNGGIKPRGLVEPDAISEQPGPLQLEAYQQLVRQPC